MFWVVYCVCAVLGFGFIAPPLNEVLFGQFVDTTASQLYMLGVLATTVATGLVYAIWPGFRRYKHRLAVAALLGCFAFSAAFLIALLLGL